MYLFLFIYLPGRAQSVLQRHAHAHANSRLANRPSDQKIYKMCDVRTKHGAIYLQPARLKPMHLIKAKMHETTVLQTGSIQVGNTQEAVYRSKHKAHSRAERMLLQVALRMQAAGMQVSTNHRLVQLSAACVVLADDHVNSCSRFFTTSCIMRTASSAS